MMSYAPYGDFAHNLAIYSSVFVFMSLYKVLISKQIEYLFLSPYIVLTWLYFQSPFLLEEKTYYNNVRVMKEEYMDEIATYTFFSVVLIYVGYTFFFRRSPKPLVSRSFTFDVDSLKSLSIYFLLLSIFYRVGNWAFPSLVASLSGLIQIFFYSPAITFALYVLYLIRSKSRPQFSFYHIAIILFIITEILLRLSTTLMAQVGVFFLGVFIVYFREKGRIPIMLAIVILLIFVPLYQSRKYFRFKSSNDDIELSQFERGFSMVDKVFIGDDQIRGNKANDLSEYILKSQESSHNRFENLSFISHVVWKHKSGSKQFLNGETFYWLPLSPIPRIIFPSKPENEMGSKVSTSYGLRGDNSTASINFPMLVEAYINFGFQGMLIMALFFGMTYKWFVMKFGAGIGDINLLIAINASKQFTHAEGNITLVFGALIQVFLFWWVLTKFFKVAKQEDE